MVLSKVINERWERSDHTEGSAACQAHKSLINTTRSGCQLMFPHRKVVWTPSSLQTVDKVVSHFQKEFWACETDPD